MGISVAKSRTDFWLIGWMEAGNAVDTVHSDLVGKEYLSLSTHTSGQLSIDTGGL